MLADDGKGHVLLKCMGAGDDPNADGPFTGTHARLLDGRTRNGSIGLAPNPDDPFSGTHWEVIDDGPGRVVLRCLGAVDGPRFLDGRTGNGTVGLAPATNGPFTGIHWEVVNPRPIDSIKVTSGNLTVPGSLPLNGLATLEIHRNGDFSYVTHAHASALVTHINYAVDALLYVPTPGGTPIEFRKTDNVNGTDPNDDQTTGVTTVVFGTTGTQLSPEPGKQASQART